MSLPAALRYLPARLRPLQNPVVWMPALALAFVGIFAWEYKNHPDWLQWGGLDTDTALETGLTPEEQAGIAEIDTLDVLINEAKSNSPSDPNAPQTNSVEADEEVAPPAGSTADSQADAQVNPFANYLAQYQFPGAGLPGQSNGTNTALQSQTGGRSLPIASGNTAANSNLFLLSQQASAAQPSALSQALSDRTTAAQQPAAEAEPNSVRPAATSSTESIPAENLPLNQSGVTRGQLSGNANVNFIRTTPAMSPPPGTTGYQPPASINLTTYDRTLNRTGQFTPGVPSATAPAPSFEVQQPQQPAGVLPGQVSTGIAQPQTQTTGTIGGSTAPAASSGNTFDDFFD